MDEADPGETADSVWKECAGERNPENCLKERQLPSEKPGKPCKGNAERTASLFGTGTNGEGI